MAESVRKHIVVSAVNIRRGGTLTVLRDCLGYLSARENIAVTAIVHNKELCLFPGIEYIEIPWSIKGWGRRLWCEYVTMRGISEKLAPVDLWLSLHDTTPSVKARRQAVYCQTSFPFLRIKARDFLMDKKIPLFAMFTRYAYKINSKRNRYMIVQQEWLREGLSNMIGLPRGRFIVAPPSFDCPPVTDMSGAEPIPLLLYPAGPDCHKNFETLCEAASILENRHGKDAFRIVLTLDGSENRYSRWLKEKWGHIQSIEFHGYMSKEELYSYYGKAAGLVFPSRVETWGLPISEFKGTGKPMILANLPYSKESSAGGKAVFFNVNDAEELSSKIELVIKRKIHNFEDILPKPLSAPAASTWEELFALLLSNEDPSAR